MTEIPGGITNLFILITVILTILMDPFGRQQVRRCTQRSPHSCRNTMSGKNLRNGIFSIRNDHGFSILRNMNRKG